MDPSVLITDVVVIDVNTWKDMDEVENGDLKERRFWGSMEDVVEEGNEVTHLTRSSRHFKPTYL